MTGVKKKLKKERRRLDYGSWLLGLEQALGRENVCALLLEESGTLAFWNDLRAFAELEYLDPHAQVNGGNRKNVRRGDRDTWKLRAFDAGFTARVEVDKWLNAFWPHGRLQESRANLRASLAKRVEGWYRTRSARLDPASRHDSIALSPEVRQEVRRHCETFNDAVGEWLGRDIRHLGY